MRQGLSGREPPTQSLANRTDFDEQLTHSFFCRQALSYEHYWRFRWGNRRLVAWSEKRRPSRGHSPHEFSNNSNSNWVAATACFPDRKTYKMTRALLEESSVSFDCRPIEVPSILDLRIFHATNSDATHFLKGIKFRRHIDSFAQAKRI